MENVKNNNCKKTLLKEKKATKNGNITMFNLVHDSRNLTFQFSSKSNNTFNSNLFYLIDTSVNFLFAAKFLICIASRLQNLMSFMPAFIFKIVHSC